MTFNRLCLSARSVVELAIMMTIACCKVRLLDATNHNFVLTLRSAGVRRKTSTGGARTAVAATAAAAGTTAAAHWPLSWGWRSVAALQDTRVPVRGQHIMPIATRL